MRSRYFFFHKMLCFQNVLDEQQGYNIVGVIPGKYYNTSLDRILVVGAHWDTYGLSPGFNDNGSGMASLLEIARVLAQASCYKPDYR